MGSKEWWKIYLSEEKKRDFPLLSRKEWMGWKYIWKKLSIQFLFSESSFPLSFLMTKGERRRHFVIDVEQEREMVQFFVQKREKSWSGKSGNWSFSHCHRPFLLNIRPHLCTSGKDFLWKYSALFAKNKTLSSWFFSASPPDGPETLLDFHDTFLKSFGIFWKFQKKCQKNGRQNFFLNLVCEFYFVRLNFFLKTCLQCFKGNVNETYLEHVMKSRFAVQTDHAWHLLNIFWISKQHFLAESMF